MAEKREGNPGVGTCRGPYLQAKGKIQMADSGQKQKRLALEPFPDPRRYDFKGYFEIKGHSSHIRHGSLSDGLNPLALLRPGAIGI